MFNLKSVAVSLIAAGTIPVAAITPPTWNVQRYAVSVKINNYFPQTAAQINNSGAIVGLFTSQEAGPLYPQHGYVRDYVGSILAIDAPWASPSANADGTQGVAITNTGAVLGTYRSPTDYKRHPFIVMDNQYFQIDLSGVTDETIPQGFNSSGEVVGYFGTHGYIQTGAIWLMFDCPGAIQTKLVAINDLGVMLGLYVDVNHVGHNFWSQGVNLGCNAIPNYPDSRETHWIGINNANQIVGWWADLTTSHGLFGDLLGNMAQYDVPGTSGLTKIFSINDNGQATAITTKPGIGTELYVLTPANPAARLTITTPAAFPVTNVSATSAPAVLTLKNIGSQGAVINGMEVYESDYAKDFVVQSTTCQHMLAAGGMCSVNVAFRPVTQGPRSGRVSINSSSAVSVSANLSGVASGRLLTPNTYSYTFGAHPVGQSSGVGRVYLKSTGTMAVALASISFQGGNAGDYKITASTCGASVASGVACSVSVVWTPSVPGNGYSFLMVQGNQDNGVQQILFRGWSPY